MKKDSYSEKIYMYRKKENEHIWIIPLTRLLLMHLLSMCAITVLYSTFRIELSEAHGADALLVLNRL